MLKALAAAVDALSMLNPLEYSPASSSNAPIHGVVAALFLMDAIRSRRVPETCPPQSTSTALYFTKAPQAGPDTQPEHQWWLS